MASPACILLCLFCLFSGLNAMLPHLDPETVDFASFDETSRFTAAADELKWVDILSLGLRGHAFNDSLTPFDRLPKAAQGTVRPEVWHLSRCTAGFYVPFETNSATIAVNFTLRFSSLSMYHFAATGVSGIDLYAWDKSDNRWRSVAISTVIKYPISFDTILSGIPTTSTHRYLLFLPTYNGVEQFSIGVDKTAKINSFAFNTNKKPVVWYGTSILQGGVAPRPGMAFTNNLTMTLGRDILNFGFSGNGKMEIEVMQYLVTLDPAVFIIDCVPNMDATMIAERTVPLVHFIRKTRPSTTIILAEQPAYGHNWFVPNAQKGDQAKKDALTKCYKQLIGEGVKNLIYLKSDYYGVDEESNPTVDGTHPHAVGMYRYAEFYAHYLPTILGNN